MTWSGPAVRTKGLVASGVKSNDRLETQRVAQPPRKVQDMAET